MVLTDSHNHLHFLPPAALATEMPVLARAGITRVAVNATSEADWPAVAALAAVYPAQVTPCFGIHPWHAATPTPGWQDRLATCLHQHPAAALGECGLDRTRGPALAIQRTILNDQLALAPRFDRTVCLHCVKCWAEMQAALGAVHPPARFLFHSYAGSLEWARSAAPPDTWFSFSLPLLQRSGPRVLSIFRGLPRDRILLESDAPPAPGTPNPPLPSTTLPEAARILAAALDLPVDSLATLTRTNAARCFAQP